MSTSIYDVWYYVNSDAVEQTVAVAFPATILPAIDDIDAAVRKHLMENTAGFVDLIIKDYRRRVTL